MKTLLVRLSSMGDLIHTLPALSDLSRHRPDIQLHWLCERAFVDIARLHPFVYQVHEINWRQWRKQLQKKSTWQQLCALQREIKAENFEQVIDSQGLLKSALAAKLARASVEGLDKNSAREPLAAWFYDKSYAVDKNKDAVWRNRHLFAQIFHYTFDEKPDFGVVLPNNIETTFLPPRYHVALHASSRDSKLWLLDNWLDLLTRLHETDGLPVLLPWGNEVERQRAQKMAQHLAFAQVCPKLTLLEAAHLLKNATMVMGVDTGLLHLANAVDAALVGIYTDSNPEKTGVQTSDWAKNIGGIGQMPSVQVVFDAVQSCLSHQSK